MNHPPPSEQLYRILGIAADYSQTVLLTGMQLDETNAAKQEMLADAQYVWVIVEREPGSEQPL